MMRPWDLRAHTFLAEHAPAYLAVHGSHDRAELDRYGSSIVEVEALRYQHLGDRDADGAHNIATTTDGIPVWLVVGGAECAASARELQRFLAAVATSGARRHIVVKWHPQCTAPAHDDAFVVVDRPLREAFRGANAAFMVGSAAPLDAYLAGVPSCSLASPSGLSMTPLDEDDYFHVAADADDAVSWLASAERRRNDNPPVDRYFIVDARLVRWRGVVDGYVNPR
jgi:surface carbohydrate biosynthesis protein (TIGR04326 family)